MPADPLDQYKRAVSGRQRPICLCKAFFKANTNINTASSSNFYFKVSNATGYGCYRRSMWPGLASSLLEQT